MLAVKVTVGKQQSSSRVNRETIRAELLLCQRCLLIGFGAVFPPQTVSGHLCGEQYFPHTPLDVHSRKLSLTVGGKKPRSSCFSVADVGMPESRGD
ncbi:hypothetical protein PDJAM_G00052760 [Pangasius djambal]|uniref:Uncharacterized protein n=1 Tax=Pangasius djambal TaxID=1691987 RepID=A0ACC5YVY9_9TELE|nr:hypothetical protein [Pangasius djambal]